MHPAITLPVAKVIAAAPVALGVLLAGVVVSATQTGIPVVPPLASSLGSLPQFVQSTTPVVAVRQGERETQAGFFYLNGGVVYLITHGRVVSGAEKLMIVVHRDPDNLKLDTIQDVPLWRADGTSTVRRLAVGNVTEFELVAVELDQDIFRDGKHFYFPFQHDSLDPAKQSNSLAQDIVTLSYPHGIYDFVNNLPVARSGVVATGHRVEFNNLPCFVVDIAFVPGSAGGPVVSREPPYRLLGVVVSDLMVTGVGSSGLSLAVNAEQVEKLVTEGIRTVRTSTSG